MGAVLMRYIGFLFFVSLASPALAHHPMGGVVPETLLHGLMSGVGHPIIGLDHFAFIVAAGVLAATINNRLWVLAPLGLVGGTLVGSAIHLSSTNIAGAEALVALSVVIAGGLMAIGARARIGILLALFALSGVFHGYAYAEAVIGAENSIITAYLAAFSATQWVIAVVAGFAARLIFDEFAWFRARKLAGSSIAMLGAVLLTQAVV
jgi:urease accessory protein